MTQYASTYTVAISGSTVTVLAGSLQIQRAVGQRSTANFIVIGNVGDAATHYAMGQLVVITDTVAGATIFRGYIDTSSEQKPAYAQMLLHSIKCMDGHYLADKRIAAKAYSNVTAAAIVMDLWSNYLMAEGVMASDGTNLLTANQSSWETDTTGAYNVGLLTMAVDTSQKWVGAQSLKIVTDGSGGYQALEVRAPAAGFTASEQITLSLYILGASAGGTLRFYCQGSTGQLGSSPSTVTLTTSWQRVTFTTTLPNPLTSTYVSIRLDTGGTSQALTYWIDGLQIEAAAAATFWRYGGTTTVQTGPTIVASVFNYVPVAQAIDALASKAAFWWLIDVNNLLQFQTPGSLTAPFTVSSSDMWLDAQPQVDNTTPMYRNRQFIVDIHAVTNSLTETRQGDSKTRAFTFSYPINQVPSAITVNGTSKTLGVKGVDTGKDWYWAKGDPILAQDTGGTILVSTDTLSVTYIGQFTAVVQSDDLNQQTVRAALEGNTTGVVEQVTQATNVNSVSEGFQLANAALTKFSQTGQGVQFTLLKPGLAEGQLVTLNVPEHGISSQPFLIESVGISDADPYLTYQISALKGPINTSWVQFFGALFAQPSLIDNVSVGSSSTLNTLQSVSESWTWTETITETTYSCPICNVGTLCGTGVLVC
jgi:hypothetical protein